MGCRVFSPQSVVRDDSEPFPKRVAELDVVLIHRIVEKQNRPNDSPADTQNLPHQFCFSRILAAAGKKSHRPRDDQSKVFGNKFLKELVEGIQTDIGPLRFMEQNDGARSN